MNTILKGLSILTWIVFWGVILKVGIGIYEFLKAYIEHPEYFVAGREEIVAQALADTIVTPLIFALILYFIAKLFSRWGGGQKGELSLVDRIKVSLSVLTNKTSGH